MIGAAPVSVFCRFFECTPIFRAEFMGRWRVGMHFSAETGETCAEVGSLTPGPSPCEERGVVGRELRRGARDVAVVAGSADGTAEDTEDAESCGRRAAERDVAVLAGSGCWGEGGQARDIAVIAGDRGDATARSACVPARGSVSGRVVVRASIDALSLQMADRLLGEHMRPITNTATSSTLVRPSQSALCKGAGK